jgi:hypothetical protein
MALDNIRQRIALLYAGIASMEVSATPPTHRVRLTLPRTVARDTP